MLDKTLHIQYVCRHAPVSRLYISMLMQLRIWFWDLSSLFGRRYLSTVSIARRLLMHTLVYMLVHFR